MLTLYMMVMPSKSWSRRIYEPFSASKKKELVRSYKKKQ